MPDALVVADALATGTLACGGSCWTGAGDAALAGAGSPCKGTGGVAFPGNSGRECEFGTAVGRGAVAGAGNGFGRAGWVRATDAGVFALTLVATGQRSADNGSSGGGAVSRVQASAAAIKDTRTRDPSPAPTLDTCRRVIHAPPANSATWNAKETQSALRNRDDGARETSFLGETRPARWLDFSISALRSDGRRFM